MSDSHALRRLLYAGAEEGSVAPRGHHHGGSYGTLISSVAVEQPAAVQPRSGLRLSSACLAGCFLGCATMRAANRERWWLGLFFMGGLYYNAVKAHKVGNGLVGHQSGFFAAGLGAIGCVGRLLVRVGNPKANRRLLCMFAALMWYEVGRYHLWSEHATEFRKEVTPEHAYGLLTEYVPPHIDTDLLPYRSVSRRRD
ncbi:uncharacterized protein TEOVI_000444300 [Trypanosoma equiperdum]|uniref:Transmembrane protein n=2 Tax=Trypanozoon TaxID=39700 RepID=Q57ZL5_TRYB2|nr:hypothetical protein, conserved [Trypanosoma brucei brucei TREU927]AAX79467.1 hypothetical protein, conserved [Trypanosoma brucei]AAZ10331.1 hypothetical protein, conserved [Trypanosoma brucei brucei TREU927]SCU72859.1 hypothetical protein, conserved [Trypanosoma equiperdum]